jgi:tRNA A-37 threonylcarbamoyl transferase component Bud32
MTIGENDDRSGLSDAGMAALLGLLLHSPRKRIASAVVDGQRVWIKRYDVERMPIGKRLHGWLTPILRPAFLRSSPLLDPARQRARESSKTQAFADAGFRVAEIVYANGAVMVMKDASPTLQTRLASLRAAGDTTAHDDLLVAACGALGRMHAAGLCHGRPHPRDMLVDGAQWGFLDYEEEPEAAMPLAQAQARDIWLMLMPTCALARAADAPRRALAAYRQTAPAAASAGLADMAGFFKPLAWLGQLAARIHRGGDLDRFLKASALLAQSGVLDEPPVSDLRRRDDERRRHDAPKPQDRR